jgi:hypothetical protein
MIVDECVSKRFLVQHVTAVNRRDRLSVEAHMLLTRRTLTHIFPFLSLFKRKRRAFGLIKEEKEGQ